jgi:hypothetical protein
MKNKYHSIGELIMNNQTILTVPPEVTRSVLTRKNAAAALGVCTTTLDRLDDLPRVNIRGRVFYRPVDIETWLAKNAKPKNGKATKATKAR